MKKCRFHGVIQLAITVDEVFETENIAETYRDIVASLEKKHNGRARKVDLRIESVPEDNVTC